MEPPNNVLGIAILHILWMVSIAHVYTLVIQTLEGLGQATPGYWFHSNYVSHNYSTAIYTVY